MPALLLIPYVLLAELANRIQAFFEWLTGGLSW